MRELVPGLRLLEPADYRRMPWKNGRGTTTEIAVFPADAGLNGKPFDWRVSMADVETDGEFSAFPGCDRTILLAEGGGMELSFDAAPPQRIEERYKPFRFKGEWHTRCRLLDGAVRDFNVMSFRQRCSHEVEIPWYAGLPRGLPAGSPWLLHVLKGNLTVANGSLPVAEIAQGESLISDHGNSGYELRSSANTTDTVVVLVLFNPVTTFSRNLPR